MENSPPKPNPQHWRGADVIWDNIPDDDDDGVIELEPLDTETSLARTKIREPLQHITVDLSPPTPYPKSQPFRFRFSLSRLLIVTTIIGVVMGAVQWLSPNIFAGTLGIVVFVGIILSAIFQIDEPKVKTLWWGVVFVYLVSTIAALLGIGV